MCCETLKGNKTDMVFVIPGAEGNVAYFTFRPMSLRETGGGGGVTWGPGTEGSGIFWRLQSWEKQNAYNFWPKRLRETKPMYFGCKLAEGRIEIF